MFDELFLRSNQPTILLDAQSGHVIRWNESFKNTFGLIAEDSNWWEHFEPRTALTRRLLKQLVASQHLQQMSLCPLERGPTSFLVDAQSFQLTDQSVVQVSFRDIEQIVHRQDLLEQTMQATATGVGTEYYRHALQTLTAAFSMDIGFIAKCIDNGDTAQMVCFLVDDKFVPNMSYPIKDTPCWSVYAKSRIYCIPNRVQQQYPRDDDLITLAAEAYIGIPIIDDSAEVIGHIAMLHRKAILPPSEAERLVLRIIAGRTCSEIRRLEVDDKLRDAKTQAENANRDKTRFLARVSHELRTPLNSVLGFAQLLQMESGLTDDQVEMLRAINRNGDALKTLVNDMLEISQLELGNIEIHWTAVPVHDFARDLESTFRPVAKNRRVDFVVVTGNDIPRMVVDAQRLRQVVSNLIDNAIKYSNAGDHVELNIARETIDNRPVVLIRVIDTGIGIAKSDLPEIFVPFTRAVDDSAPGVGLGLSIVESLCKAMDLKLDVTSELGHGTEFQIQVPAEIAEATEPPMTPPQTDGRTPQTILVVDDNHSNRQVVRLLLQTSGYRIVEASSGAQALELCESAVPDLILMDIRMPGMDGIETTTELQRRLQDQCPPVLGLTGDILNARGERLETDCFEQIVNKPFVLQDLLDAIANPARRS